MREIKRCENCGRYMMAVESRHLSDDDVERLKYCDECKKEMGRPKTLEEIEYETFMRQPTARDVQARDEELERRKAEQEKKNN